MAGICLDCKSRALGGCVGLVNCTTIDWFTEWPADALYEVAVKQLADEDLGSQEIKSNMCKVGLAPSTHLYLPICTYTVKITPSATPSVAAHLLVVVHCLLIGISELMSDRHKCFLTALCLQSL